jgi:hypothetical protein
MKLSTEDRTNAIDWLLECGYDEEDLAECSDARIAREIANEFEGGWAAFQLACV